MSLQFYCCCLDVFEHFCRCLCYSIQFHLTQLSCYYICAFHGACWALKEAQDEKEMTFEEKIKELEGIVTELESGNVNLDDAIKKYTRAMELSKECSDKLNEVTEQVNKILLDNGKLEDFKVEEEK